MNINIDDLFDKSYVISINDIRYEQFLKRFKNNDINYIIKKYEGFTMKLGNHLQSFSLKDNFLNCSLSHASLIRHAQLMNYPYVLIFEDDALPCLDFNNKIQKYLQHIPDDIHILKLGYTRPCNINDKDYFINNLYNIKKTFGAHAYIIFQKYYSEYFRVFSEHPFSDHQVFNSDKSYSTKDIMFIQYNNLSETIHGYRNEKYFNKFLNKRELDQISNFKLN